MVGGHCDDTARSASAAVLTSADLVTAIFAALPAKSLVTACRVCRQWRDVERENEEALWRPLCSQLALLRGAKRQYESSARLARLSSKRRCRVLHSNLHSHVRQTRSPNAVLTNDYKFEVEVDNAGCNAFHGVAETRTVESNEVCLSVECNSVDSPATVHISDKSMGLRVFVTRRCDNKVALLMELPLGALVTGPSGEQNVFVTATGFEVQDARSFLPASFVGHMESSWFVFFAAHICPDSKLQRVVLHLYCKASGLQASAFVDDTSPTQVTSGELLELLKHVDWA